MQQRKIRALVYCFDLFCANSCRNLVTNVDMNQGVAHFSDLSEADDNSNEEIKVHPKRWTILLLTMITSFMTYDSQGSYGVVNNGFSKYFHKEPCQIDWLVLMQTAIFTLTCLVLSVFAKRLGFKTCLCITISALTTGLAFAAGGVLTRDYGYGLVLIGQALEGLVGGILGAIVPTVAAIWFPPKEVAIAVAAQFFPRGLGEATGNVVAPYIVTSKSEDHQVQDIEYFD